MDLFNKIFDFIEKYLGSRKKSNRFSRNSKSIQIEKGKENEFFQKKIAEIIGSQSHEVDLYLNIQNDYNCDIFDFIKCINIAEETWKISLMPHPFTLKDTELYMHKYKSFADILRDIQK